MPSDNLQRDITTVVYAFHQFRQMQYVPVLLFENLIMNVKVPYVIFEQVKGLHIHV